MRWRTMGCGAVLRRIRLAVGGARGERRFQGKRHRPRRSCQFSALAFSRRDAERADRAGMLRGVGGRGGCAVGGVDETADLLGWRVRGRVKVFTRS